MKNYIVNHFYLQYLVLLTMVPRNSAVLYCTGTSNPFTATDGPLFWSSGRQDAACTSSLLLPLLSLLGFFPWWCLVVWTPWREHQGGVRHDNDCVPRHRWPTG